MEHGLFGFFQTRPGSDENLVTYSWIKLFCLVWSPSMGHGSGFSFQEPAIMNNRLELFLRRLLVSLLLADEECSPLNSKVWICSTGAEDTIFLGKPWSLWVIGLQWQQQSFQSSLCSDENWCSLNSLPIYADGHSTQTPGPGEEWAGGTANIDRGLTPGSFFRRLLFLIGYCRPVCWLKLSTHPFHLS